MTNDTIYIFLCSKSTRGEVISRDLVGTTYKEWQREFRFIKKGDRVVVYDYEEFEFIGPYEISECNNGKAIEPKAWGGKFPCQARVRLVGSMNLKKVKVKEMENDHNFSSISWTTSNKPSACVKGLAAKCLNDWFHFPEKPTITHPSVVTKPPQEPTITITGEGHPTYKTKQGFNADSKAEARIADLLEDWGIRCRHNMEVPGAGGYRYDFYLPEEDIYIEYWGLKGNTDYDRNTITKVKKYYELGLRLIQLDSSDEEYLETRLRDELERKGVVIKGATAVPEQQHGFFNWLLRLLGFRS